MEVTFGSLLITFVVLNAGKRFLAKGDTNTVGHKKDSDITYDKASLDKRLDVCRFVEINPTCRPGYVITAMATKRLGPGNCGCFRQNLEMSLYERCLGVNTCALGYADLKVDTNIYAPPPTEFCWFKYRIVYTCEPAMSMCPSDGTYTPTKTFPLNVNLISPGYPLSYPGTQEARPPLVCETELTVSKRGDEAGEYDRGVTITQTDLSLPDHQFIALCGGNVLHVGASHDKLGPDMWDNCVGSGLKFEIETPFHIFYHYNYDFSYHRGVILKIQANDQKAVIRAKYVDGLEPTGSTGGATRVPPEMFNVPGKKINTPIHRLPDEYQNSTAGEKPTEQDLLKGSFLFIIIGLSAVAILLLALIIVLCLWRRRHTSWKVAAESTSCCICCQPASQSIANKESVRLSNRPGSTINPYACTELFPINDSGHYENEYRDPELYVNTTSRPTKYRPKIPSAIYAEIEDGEISNVYETHLPTSSATKEEYQNLTNENNFPQKGSTTKRKEPFANSERKKSDDGYDSNSNDSIVLQEGENLLVENELYDSAS